ncbi:hypothetical protein BC477_05905 [Clavibacter michiganensis subsp. michiganensis]|uniref:Uncharacterized protein n=1 Tax=Clavibacter michiganensis subsp. michiganensis TaxID=33013 RepID=A0A251XM28_CLAMM|nr:hypothetical protein BC477_05905 [Clavibacter michiganensis subsp. michiganensis]OUE04249.1 hypothetical protein CMMCAS07_04835 [Clavibacter michiganensis subsp. michiganensis]
MPAVAIARRTTSTRSGESDPYAPNTKNRPRRAGSIFVRAAPSIAPETTPSTTPASASRSSSASAPSSTR